MNHAGGPAFKVLVVEDEPLIGMLIEDVIDDLGWETIGPVATLADALALAHTESIDCAVLDANVRGGRTHPVAELLLGRGIPFLVASGYGDWALPDQLLSEYRLQKPYTSDQLRNELRLLATRAQARSA